MELSPASGAFTIDFGCLGEAVQSVEQSLPQVVGLDERQCLRLEQCAAVVRGVSRVPLGVDGQPRLTFGAQDVTSMQVAVDETVRLVVAQLLGGCHGRVHHVPGQRMRQFPGVLAELVRPGICLLLEPGKSRGAGTAS